LKHDLEYSRFKNDCRKKALEVAERTVSQVQAGVISDSILSEADKYYANMAEGVKGCSQNLGMSPLRFHLKEAILLL